MSDMARPRIAVVFTGGTISMRVDAQAGGAAPGLGGGVRCVRLGGEFFDEHGRINEPTVRFADLARHAYFSETGVHGGRAVARRYNGIPRDESVDGGIELTSATLEHLPAHEGPKVVAAAGCRFSRARPEREGITIKQTPYASRTR